MKLEDRLSEEFVYWQTEDGKSRNWTRLPTPVCWGCAADSLGNADTATTSHSDMKYLDERGLSAQCGGCGRVYYRQVGNATGLA